MVELLEATFLDFLREDEGSTPAFQSRTQTCVPESFLLSVEKLVMALSLCEKKWTQLLLPPHALGFTVTLSRFTNNGVKHATANMR